MPAATGGTPSIPAACAPHACISGPKRNASPAINGRPTQTGTSKTERSKAVIARTLENDDTHDFN